MKKILFLTTALGLAGASSLMAGTIDVFITGSTAFRANVYGACQKLYVGASPTVYYADGAHGGADGAGNSGTASWVMTGTPATSLTTIQNNTLVIHGFFTGSIQGLETTEQGTKLVFAQPHGSAGNNADTYTTNAPTIGFSDASGVASPYPATGSFVEENVCVQPFVWCTSTAASGAITTIGNITWEQVQYGIPVGRIPLSAWSYKNADTNTFVYLLQRTKDSGTRRCETQGSFYQYNDTCATYIYDPTNFVFYTPTVYTNFGYGFSTDGAGVIGTEGPGLGNANMNTSWGFGYIGGGDIKNALNKHDGNNATANQSIAYLSMNDSKGVNNGGGNWSTVISYNGIWPTAAGIGIHNNSGTNDYSPITLGYYPLWGFEVLVHPESSSTATTIPGQDLTYGQLGDYLTPGSFMGVFNAQSYNNGGVVTVGSIENEIILSQPGGATAIPIAAMQNGVNTRPSVGGTIYPLFQ